MYYVYLLQSENESSRFYIGLTSDLRERIKAHNRGQSTHTSKYVPWKLFWYSAFSDKKTARDFETYLKTGSGRRFQIRHLKVPI